jgi:outer membrane lipoprotein-sorting protein
LDYQSEGGIVTITLEDRQGHVPGSLVLVYDAEARMLQQWVVIDGQGRRTTVTLENIQAGVEADPKLFTVSVTRAGQRKKDR